MDYSDRKGNGGGRRRNNARRGGGLPTPVAILLGLTVGLMVAAVVVIKFKPVENKLSEQLEPDRAAPEPLQPEVPDGRFTFYDTLPNYEVVVRGAGSTGKRNPETSAPVKQPGHYVIQAGSFSTAQEADRRKANLALLGVESRIETGAGPDGKSRYRVRVGPLQDLERVNSTLKTLRENGIDALLMRQKA